LGDLCFTPDGVACRGLLVRHLVMPGLLDDSAAILNWLGRLSPDTFVNIMAQYHPENRVGRPTGNAGEQTTAFEEINRRPTSQEIERAYEYARQAGLWRFDFASPY
jgi:putative pyruvate formate lyase activating enzyme